MEHPLCIVYFLQNGMYAEAAVVHNTVLEGMEGKSQPQTATCAERQVQTTQTNTEQQTTEEGQLFTSSMEIR